MNAPPLTLIVLAAGIGSRYGGLKQIDSFGPRGERILDFSLYDARMAGFSKVVFVIRREIEADFREAFGVNVESRMDVDYAFQSLDDLPPPFHPPAGRVKPWGTGHAVLAARRYVPGPFAVINADDFYGPSAYAMVAGFLGDRERPPDTHALVAFELGRTLSDSGSVARGLCRVGEGGMLASVTELTNIAREDGVIIARSEAGEPLELDPRTPVSMNFWGFGTSLFNLLESGFTEFLREEGSAGKAEFYLPSAVDALLSSGKARVRVLRTPDKWFGVTYVRDRDTVAAGLRARIASGIYPAPLWQSES